MNTPDTEKCEHNVVGKYCFRCKRPDLACRCNCLNFYKIECNCPCHSQVEIEQNAETGEVLTANGIDLTPQKKGGWEEDFELCFRYFFMDMADGAVKHDIKCFIRSLLSSRDTYWKERVRKEVEGMKKDFVPADLIWEGDEEQEVGEWKYVPKEDGMYCLNCERFVPEEGCICGLISFEALDTLLDNLK